MEAVNEHTDIISALGKTARKTLDTNLHSDDNNDDMEFASSGFYVREKPTKKSPESTDDITVENGDKDQNEQKLVNGTTHDDQLSKITSNGNILEKSDPSMDINELSSEKKENDDVDLQSEIADKILSEISPQLDVTNCGNIDEVILNTVKSNFESNEEACVNSDNPCNDTNDSNIANNSDAEKGSIEEAVSNPEKKDDEDNSEKDKVETIEGENKIIEGENSDDEPKKVIESDSKEDKEVESTSVNTEQSENVTENIEPEPESEKQEVPDKKDEPEPETETQEEKKSISENEDQCQEVSENKEDAHAESNKKNDTNTDDKTESDPEKKIENEENATSSTVNLDEADSSKNGTENEASSTSNNADVDKENNVISSPPRDERDLECLGLLRKELVKPVNDNSYMDEEMDEDFDPTLLCPDISMDVDEQQPVDTDYCYGDTPMLYEPIFCTLVDEITGAEVQIDLTPEEMEIRKKMYGPENPVQITKIHCTACNQHLGSAMAGAHNRFVHPLLKVLICKTCYHFYTSGEFEKDEDGSELYCRWCGQGGQVLCCSSCEYVFCKRCIRNNFGTKKFKEIRDSEDWNCFRCHPEQLSRLRAECAEFMDWYRTERARTNALGQTDQDKVDFTKCCSGPKKKDESKAPTTTRRRKKNEDDPDYDPIRLEDEPPAKKPVPIGGPSSVMPMQGTFMRVNQQNKTLVPIVPRALGPATVVRQPGQQIFKVGATTFKTRVGLGNMARPAQVIRTGPGLVKLVPANRMQTTAPRPATSGATPTRINQTTVRPVKTSAPMKHEWFEKTVRSSARVNSNLSFTLTQLNRQQSQATNVEALARVHNKLQEVLSTSINSLIQIRKNLRSEFIQGIKNMKVTPKPIPSPKVSGTITVADDDDVILVTSPTTTTKQQTATVNTTSTAKKKNPNPIALHMSKPPPLVFTTTTTTTAKSSSKTNTTASSASQPRTLGFLKVRSLTALQTIPSECITIPDDPLPVIDNSTLRYSDDPMIGTNNDSITIDDSPSKSSEDPLKVTGTSVNNVEGDKLEGIIEINDDPPKVAEKKVTRRTSTQSKYPKEQSSLVYNIKNSPTIEIKRMMGAYVNVVRSEELEKLLLSTSTDKDDVSDIKLKEPETL